MKKLNNKGIAPILLAVIIVAVAGVGFAGYRVYQNSQNEPEPEETIQSEPEKNQITTDDDSNNKNEEISEDIVVCSVNPNAESGEGTKVAFYGYVKNDIYTKVWVEYGPSTTDLGQKTEEFPNGIDNCSELMVEMPTAGLSPGKYFYKVATTTHDGTVVYSEISNFTVE